MSMMDDMKLLKTPGRPAQHAGLYLIHRIPAGRGPESANIVPTLPSVYFCCPPYVKRWALLEFFHTIFKVTDYASTDSQARLIRKYLEAALEIIRLKRQVSIQFDQKIPVLALERSISLIECLDDSATCLSKSAVRPVNDSNPGILLCIFVDDAPSFVRGAIIYNDPFLRKNRLMGHAIDCKAYVSLFVTDGAYNHIICAGC